MTKSRTSISVSVRRHFVDNFFSKSFKELLSGKKVDIIDIGGKKMNKRGLFNAENFGSTTYVNLEKSSNPDILSDARDIPVDSASYDIAIMGELLEHVSDPIPVINEAHRILKNDGLLFITVPFIYPLHGDPDDYGRYTESYWKANFKKIGFEIVKLERHGGMFSVLALMIQHLFRAKNKSWEPIQSLIIKLMMWFDSRTQSPLLKSWTTGYGIIIRKK